MNSATVPIAELIGTRYDLDRSIGITCVLLITCYFLHVYMRV